MSNCPNCGAPARGARCEYCGTVFDRQASDDTPAMNYIPLRDFGTGYEKRSSLIDRISLCLSERKAF